MTPFRLLMAGCAVAGIWGCQPALVMPECQSWSDMVASDKVSSIRIGGYRGDTALQMEFAYVNHPELGMCILGADRYSALRKQLEDLDRPALAFWVGAGGPMDIFYKPEGLFLVQASSRYELLEIQDIEAPLTIDGAPELFDQDLVLFEGHPDPVDPVTIYYRQREILLSGEYWFE